MTDTTKEPEKAAAAAGDYSKEEMTTLTNALAAVVLGAGLSSKPGAFGLMREFVSAMKASAEFAEHSNNPLIQQILSKSNPSDEHGADTSKIDPEKAMNDGIEAAKSTQAMLVAKGKQADADAWTQLLLAAANAAVNATKSGGFLGIGGEKVTDAERAYIQRLSDALGVK